MMRHYRSYILSTWCPQARQYGSIGMLLALIEPKLVEKSLRQLLNRTVMLQPEHTN